MSPLPLLVLKYSTHETKKEIICHNLAAKLVDEFVRDN